MNNVYAISSNIVSSLGLTTSEMWSNVMSGHTGIHQFDDEGLSPVPFYGSKLSVEQWQNIEECISAHPGLSSFEQLCVYSAKEALSNLQIPLNQGKTVLILSTTKGNIDLLGKADDMQLLLHSSAAKISSALGFMNKPIVISHACVSGVLACLYALRTLQSGRYEHAIVIGADRFSKFVLSGFQSFQAVANEPCRPFDAQRKGINLGEAAATIILSTHKNNDHLARLVSGSTSNDANHISGPSRTGEELALAIERALVGGGVTAQEIDMVSAHGTATLYNDEMESKAFVLAGLSKVPVHSLKGYVGHTLGAAGIVESVMIIQALQHQKLIPSAGFNQLGVTGEINVTTEATQSSLRHVLKTASGFGGCNATAVWAKV